MQELRKNKALKFFHCLWHGLCELQTTMNITSKIMMTGAFAASAATAFGAGFGLNEVSARGNALQGTLVGSTRDISAVYFNPANMTELKDGGIYTMAGLTLLRPDFYTSVAGQRVDQDEKIFVDPHFYVGGRVAEDFWFGFGEYSEYGLGTRYENRNSWPLAADSAKTTITSFTLSPTVAWQATEDLSLAAGLRLLYLDVIMDRMIPQAGSMLHITADDWVCSYILSAAYQLTDTVRVGLVYRGKSDVKPEGDAELTRIGYKCDADGELDMPQSVMAGVNWQATQRLNLGFNATWNGWSSNKDIKLNFDSPLLGSAVAPQEWHDTWRFSLGGEYQLSEFWSMQLGVTFDEDPSDIDHANTMCPPGDRNQAGIGFTYAKDDWAVSFDYMYVYIHDTERQIHGVDTRISEARTDTFGLTFSKRF